MKALVVKADLDNYKHVADSVRNITTWEQFVIEAQWFDIKSWLGDEFLNEIVSQSETIPETLTAANRLLLDGGVYSYCGRQFNFMGLKACIIYYAFARFTNRTSVNYTAAGVVRKESEFSTPVSDKTIQRLETEARLMADSIKCEIITFLNRKHDDYPLWRDCSRQCPGSRPFLVIGE